MHSRSKTKILIIKGQDTKWNFDNFSASNVKSILAKRLSQNHDARSSKRKTRSKLLDKKRTVPPCQVWLWRLQRLLRYLRLGSSLISLSKFGNPTYIPSHSKTQCGNLSIFLSRWFYVISILLKPLTWRDFGLKGWKIKTTSNLYKKKDAKLWWKTSSIWRLYTE